MFCVRSKYNNFRSFSKIKKKKIINFKYIIFSFPKSRISRMRLIIRGIFEEGNLPLPSLKIPGEEEDRIKKLINISKDDEQFPFLLVIKSWTTKFPLSPCVIIRIIFKGGGEGEKELRSVRVIISASLFANFRISALH